VWGCQKEDEESSDSSSVSSFTAGSATGMLTFLAVGRYISF